MQLLLYLLIFSLVAGVFLGVFYLLKQSGSRLEERVQQTARSSQLADSTPELILGDMTPALAGQLPLGEEDRSELQRELRVAGYYRPTALMEYAALRAMLIIVPLVAAAVIALFTSSLNYALWIWGIGAFLAILGFSLPRIYIYYRGRARMHQIERALPTAIDMLTLCLGAGLNVLNSLQRVTQELHLSFPVLAYEFEIIRRQAELRTLEFALAQFADRVGLPQARNISVILSQSENLGTDAVSTLREYADNMRVNLRQRADEMSNKAPFKLLFPAYLMAFGAAILLISPVILEFSDFRRNNMIGGSISRARDLIKPNSTTTPPPAPP